jgi:hypothetical protein
LKLVFFIQDSQEDEILPWQLSLMGGIRFPLQETNFPLTIANTQNTPIGHLTY